MAILSHRSKKAILASFLLSHSANGAFIGTNRHATLTTHHTSFSPPRSFAITTNKIERQLKINQFGTKTASKRTHLSMAADDLNESKYSEGAWACMASLTSVADYYSATTVEAPMLLDVMLNPAKHSAGEDADSAKTVAEKVFIKADVNLQLLRQELDKYMAKQPKISGSMEAQKVLGRNLMKVVEKAKETKTLLGVRTL